MKNRSSSSSLDGQFYSLWNLTSYATIVAARCSERRLVPPHFSWTLLVSGSLQADNSEGLVMCWSRKKVVLKRYAAKASACGSLFSAEQSLTLVTFWAGMAKSGAKILNWWSHTAAGCMKEIPTRTWEADWPACWFQPIAGDYLSGIATFINSTLLQATQRLLEATLTTRCSCSRVPRDAKWMCRGRNVPAIIGLMTACAVLGEEPQIKPTLIMGAPDAHFAQTVLECTLTRTMRQPVPTTWW